MSIFDGKRKSASAEKTGVGEFDSAEQLYKAYTELKEQLERAKENAAPQSKAAWPSKIEEGEDVATTSPADERPETESDFVAFLKQFPEADPQGVIEGVVAKGDYAAGGFTREYVRQLKERISALEAENSSEEEILKKAMEREAVKSEIVKEYLKAMAGKNSAAPISVNGAPAMLPPSKPKSISEAGKLARDIFYKKFN